MDVAFWCLIGAVVLLFLWVLSLVNRNKDLEKMYGDCAGTLVDSIRERTRMANKFTYRALSSIREECIKRRNAIQFKDNITEHDKSTIHAYDVLIIELEGAMEELTPNTGYDPT